MTIDYNILNYILENGHNDFFDFIMPIITYLGEGGIIWIIIGCLFLIKKDTRIISISVFLTLIIGFLLGNLLLKNIIKRERPCNEHPEVALLIERPSERYSFPSGHTLSSFGASTAVFIYKKRYGIFAFLLASLIGFSRIYLFVHFPSDVLGGIFFGIIFGIIAFYLIKLILKKINKYKENKVIKTANLS